VAEVSRLPGVSLLESMILFGRVRIRGTRR
jgi:hypothetical protein